jgi:hypothetical protein
MFIPFWILVLLVVVLLAGPRECECEQVKPEAPRARERAFVGPCTADDVDRILRRGNYHV